MIGMEVNKLFSVLYSAAQYGVCVCGGGGGHILTD